MNTIRISIGTEPSQHIATEVLKSSILRRTSRPVDFTQSWVSRELRWRGNPHHVWNTYPGEDWGDEPDVKFPEDADDYILNYDAHGGWHPLMRSVPRLRGTKFSLWRWLVPEVYNFSGRSIYLDADQVVLADIGELWESLPDNGKAFAAVCNAVGIFGKKVPELDHVQTSVMVMDCARLGNGTDLRSFITATERGEYSYKNLMQAAWKHRSDIHELPPEWNHFGIVTPETKLVHWSHVASQPWRNKQHPTADVWERELRATIEAGHLSPETLKEECDKGHVDEIFWKRFRSET